MNKILVIDDEPGIRTVLTDILEDEKYSVLTAENGYEGLAVLKSKTIDLVILDVWLPNMGGIDVLKEIKKDFKDVEVIIISGHANIDLAVNAVKLGAFDFLEKPLSLEKVITTVRNALNIEKLKKQNKAFQASLFTEDKMIGSCKRMKKIWKLIEQSAKTDVKVLILGENGTGKELVAREIHKRSDRSEGPFIEVNCAAIPDTLIESELFGHEKGAFTSAVARRKGKFEIADGGTLFLDEIADMSLNAQAKVLRAIQELRFERVGGEEVINVDIRLITATNKNIQQEIKEKRFREDLFFRLNVIPIEIPPLRDRDDDIQLLINYFLDKFGRPGENKKITLDGISLLKGYRWPGNIRELKNFIERITIMGDDNLISAESVQYFLGETNSGSKQEILKEFESMKLNEARDLFEKKLLTEKLEENGYNISQTAEILGIYPSNLHGKIKKFGIEIKK